MDQIIETGAADSPNRFIFAHGAGAPMDHPWMDAMAHKIAARGVHVVRFNFDYMIERSLTGKKRPPDRAPKLLARFANIIDHYAHDALVVVGKSMGGRMASLIAAGGDHVPTDLTINTPIKGLWCLGYPFHPPGKPEKLRTDHLSDIKITTLISQGERDPFGKRDEVDQFNLPQNINIHWLADGDHGLSPRKKSGLTLDENMDHAIDHAAQIFDF